MRKISIFVTGTDTGVGKTRVTGILAHFFEVAGYRTVTQKWVQTGCTRLDRSDVAEHLRIMGRSQKEIKQIDSDRLPYMFKFAASPHLAARSEKKRIDPKKIFSSYDKLLKRYDAVVVEGAGGLMVPLGEKLLLIDLVAKKCIPTVIVVENKLGAINQTLLAIEALKARKIPIVGIMFNRLRKGQDERILRDNVDTISKIAGVRVIGELGVGCRGGSRAALHNAADTVVGQYGRGTLQCASKK